MRISHADACQTPLGPPARHPASPRQLPHALFSGGVDARGVDARSSSHLPPPPSPQARSLCLHHYSCLASRQCRWILHIHAPVYNARLSLPDFPCVIVSRFIRIITTDAASFSHRPAMLQAMYAHNFLYRPPVRGAQGASRSWPLEAGLQRTLGTAVFRVMVFSGVCPIVGFLVTRRFHS